MKKGTIDPREIELSHGPMEEGIDRCLLAMDPDFLPSKKRHISDTQLALFDQFRCN